MSAAPRSSTDPAAFRWLVIGHFGGRNLGDEAMLAALLEGGMARGHRFRVATLGGHLPAGFDAVEPIPQGARAIFAALWSGDGLVLGGGTNFHDSYGGTRHVRHLWVMLRYLALIALARMLDRPVLWISTGLGPFRRRSTRLVAWLALKLTTGATFRDAAAMRECTVIGQPIVPMRVFDITACQAVPPACPAAARPERMAVSVMASEMFATAALAEVHEFQDGLAEALAMLLRIRPGLEVSIMVIGAGHHDNDSEVSAALHQRLSGQAPGRVSLVAFNPEPEALAMRLAETRLVLATRFHMAVFGYLAGCALALVPYHGKLMALAEEIGLSKETILAPGSRLDAATMAARLGQLLDHPGGFAPALPLAQARQMASLSFAMLDAAVKSGAIGAGDHQSGSVS